MKMKTTLLTLLISTITFSQNLKLTGKVYSILGEAIANANIYLNDTLKCKTDEFGFYEIDNLFVGDFNVKVSCVGFKSDKKIIRLFKNDKLDFLLSPDEIVLGESIVKGEIGKTPYTFSNINVETINRKVGSREAVYGISSTPNIYVSPQGGGVGDLRLSIRGFNQTNIGVMIDGVPVNNPENGEIYWSNWAGMSDIIQSVEVQKGLGFVPYSISSIGGNVNFITLGKNSEEFIKIKNEFASDNYKKFQFALSKKINDNFSLTLLFSKKDWDGYAEQTKLNEITYFITTNYKDEKNFLKINLYGSPQEHGQRLTLQNLNYWKTHGANFNPDWGYLNGKPLNLRNNVFHKPTLSIKHDWLINKKLINTNTIYFSFGEGGGIVPPWYEFKRTKSGLIDFDYEYNLNSSTIDSNYSTTLKFTKNALRFTVHKHYWSGIISSLKYFIDSLVIISGFDYKYYLAENYRKIENLLGGDYTIGSSDINRNPNDLLFVGDKVDYNADSYTKQYGVFFNSQYTYQNISNFFNMSLSNTAYKRIDYFNFKKDDPNKETKWKNIFSYTIKSGIIYNFDNNNVYLNYGYFTKPPLSENVYDYNNNLYNNIVNEKINSVEFGYNYFSSSLNIKLNFYITSWKDKAFSQTIQDFENGKFYFVNISGANAIHQGFEFETKKYFSKNFYLNSLISLNKNRWTNNINTVLAPESNPKQQVLVQSFVKDTFVGGFPMTMLMFEAYYAFNHNSNILIYFNPELNYYGNYYSQFNPNFRNTNKNPINSWKIPDYFLINLHTGLDININSYEIKEVKIKFSIFNLLNRKDYVVDAIDGINHDQNTSLVWLGRERWWFTSISLKF